MKQRIQKKKEAAIFKQFEPFFSNMLLPLLQFTEEFNPSEYRTSEGRIKQRLEKQFEETEDQEYVGAGLLKLVATIDISLWAKENQHRNVREMHELIQNDERFKELHNLIEDVENKYSNSAFILFLQNNPLEILAKGLEPYDLIEGFKNQKGEIAGRTAIRIFREVAELVYVDYLNAIHGFAQLLEGKTEVKRSESFGSLAAQLPGRLKKLGYEKLVDCDAAWLRNATCHGHWKYHAEIGKITLWDLKKPEQFYTPEELVAKAIGMYSMVVNNYLPMINLYLKNKLGSIPWITVIKYFQKNMTSLINKENAKTETMTQKVQELFLFSNIITFK